ncbi:MAG: hypothetical protein WCZ89_09830 [Phycisphaerae bacterium]
MSLQRNLFRIIGVSFTVFCINFFVRAGDWNIEVIETQVGISNEISCPIVLDSNGLERMSYFNNFQPSTALNLIYARRSGTSWTKQTVLSNELTMDDRALTAIALDSNDYPYICYRNSSKQLSYVYQTSSGWSSKILIDSSIECDIHDMVMDSNDKLHIVYSYSDPYGGGIEHGELKLAVGRGTSFPKKTIASNGQYVSAAIALDSSGIEHVSYYDKNNNQLIYSVRDGNIWQMQIIDSVGIVLSSIRGSVSIAIDSNDYAHISYYDFVNFDLKYARWNGSVWSIQTIDSIGAVGRYSSLALDSADRPHIAYQDTTNGALKYAMFDGTSWQIETIDDTGTSGRYACIALTSYDRIRISYFDMANRTVRFAGSAGGCGDMFYMPPKGDLSRNCYVDMADYSMFAWWFETGCSKPDWCYGADLNKSGMVDVNDLMELCQNWLIYTGP